MEQICVNVAVDVGATALPYDDATVTYPTTPLSAAAIRQTGKHLFIGFHEGSTPIHLVSCVEWVTLYLMIDSQPILATSFILHL